jgi:hypothetical protein
MNVLRKALAVTVATLILTPAAWSIGERGTDRAQVAPGLERGTDRAQVAPGLERGTDRAQVAPGLERGTDRA